MIRALAMVVLCFAVSGCGDSGQATTSSQTQEYKSISALSEFPGWELVTDVSEYSGQYRVVNTPCRFSEKFAPEGIFFPDDNPCKYQFNRIPGYQQRITCIESDKGKRLILRHKKSNK